MVAGFAVVLLFFFVPETFWDRTPHPRPHIPSKSMLSAISHLFTPSHGSKHRSASQFRESEQALEAQKLAVPSIAEPSETKPGTIAQRRQQKPLQRVGFAETPEGKSRESENGEAQDDHLQPNSPEEVYGATTPARATHLHVPEGTTEAKGGDGPEPLTLHRDAWRVVPAGKGPKTPALHDLNSPYYTNRASHDDEVRSSNGDVEAQRPSITINEAPKMEHDTYSDPASSISAPLTVTYTHQLREGPPKTFRQTLKPWNGRLRKEKWLRVAVRPFILFAYPAILWSTLVYSLSIGWLIVLSESVATIYRNPETYNFTAIQTGLVYISPFIGGVLGTAVAGKVSDIIVRFLSRRNDGVYEPEFRLVMAIPVMISTCIGLMGFGWSAELHDSWIVPTVMFGVISFGCSLGSTTAITFAVDSYRQYAGEALVTLNFSKSKSWNTDLLSSTQGQKWRRMCIQMLT